MTHLPKLFLLLIAGLAMDLASSLPASAGDRPYGPLGKTRSSVQARHGMAATSQPLAAQTAIRVLEKGGNAIDAAIAANAVIGVVEPMSCGLGGDLFAIVWDAKTKKLYGLNASGRAPYAATIEHFHSKGYEYIPSQGPLSWSVPGCVSGWDELMRRFGTKTWPELMKYAIDYADEGFPLSEIIAGDWKSAERLLARVPTSAHCFLPDGKAPRSGEIFRNPDLAKSLKLIASEGASAYYKGAIAAGDRRLFAKGRRAV